ncbi:hypothetical protein [Halococcoides cellulosivorans]|uniref:DUF2238 domain-containing protein n=1 Tax=Halococcoides cellulosivorans TaxID=1679096 RepID=A0A2R4X119_9EURY|nr:hypothetical protein [Halococcoides cellulosivorans]AWB27492.1 hypothetical protein HARCEL1_07110 [Halococcoides cellulosivorans]
MRPDWLRLSADQQRRLTWLMQVVMVGLLFVGLERGSVAIVVNVAIGLAVIQIPSVLERDPSVAMDPRLTLWITTAVFLHSVGAVGLPGGSGLYKSVPYWDSITHTLSSSIVAAVGYATTRAIDEHTDRVRLPDRFVFVFVLLFVMAFGVAWEVMEFTTSRAATALGGAPVLTQYGIDDTMTDLLFNTAGALIVAALGSVYAIDELGLQSIVESLLDRVS